MNGLARILAILGGAVLISLIALTCLSVIGRILNSIGHSQYVEATVPFIGDFLKAFGPINGDYELVEAGIALAIFLFLPWCQLNRKHATVELLSSMVPTSFNHLLNILWEVVLTLTTLLITWRIYVGMSDKMRYGETTFLLQMPVWWAFAACTFAAFCASIVAIYCVYLRVTETAPGDSSHQSEGGMGV
ncbi:MAG: TRAP transporter small permease subunit [Rhizobiaceae bacterium]|nr:TRAP transporter small permease subunit [Rhizobiaceae bacterium]